MTYEIYSRKRCLRGCEEVWSLCRREGAEKKKMNAFNARKIIGIPQNKTKGREKKKKKETPLLYPLRRNSPGKEKKRTGKRT